MILELLYSQKGKELVSLYDQLSKVRAYDQIVGRSTSKARRILEQQIKVCKKV